MSAFQFGGHICGVHYVSNHRRTYLPPIELVSHSTVTPVSFTTQLQQTYRTAEAVSQLRYTFPLYDGIAVSGYEISFAGQTLNGVVKQKEDAKKTYQEAIDRGETAGLLESLPAGVFGVTLGNVPAETELIVNITYCGELKHDAGVDGMRYTLPTSIAPRYGSYPGTVLSSNVGAAKMAITVDLDMGTRSAIRRVQSPSHPIAVTMGEVSGTRASADTKLYTPSQASASLTQGNTELGSDFVLQVIIDDLSRPQAILEVHPRIPNQRAIMTTMVPKFVLESAHPEIVFVADQSGSMSGSKNQALVAALKIFLKSLPIGVRFNICAFGNSFKFLWEQSQAYNEEKYNLALSFVKSFGAQYGGTEMLEPLKAAFASRLKDLPFELLVLTDGQIWQEEAVFQFISKQIEDGVDARVFTLGIGSDVSHSLVGGLARVGHGFAQFVTQNEDTDQKVMRMLKASLFAHTGDYQLEVHYLDAAEERVSDEDDFEIIEKVKECLHITPTEAKPAEPAKPKSFFDATADIDAVPAATTRYGHLPVINAPKLLQAPSSIPPLFPFNRSTTYLLLDEKCAQKEVKSVTLRASSANGPLELEIPITAKTSGVSIHQLAARKAIQDLEDGRGWLTSAHVGDDQQTLVKDKYAGRFDEIVEREAVRLGETFQVASKWTSFVAVQQDGQAEASAVSESTGPETAKPQASKPMRRMLASFGARKSSSGPTASFGLSPQQIQAQMAQQPMMQVAPMARRTGSPGDVDSSSSSRMRAAPTPGGLFGNSMPPTPRSEFGSTASPAAPRASAFAFSGPAVPPPPPSGTAPSGALFGSSSFGSSLPRSAAPQASLFGSGGGGSHFGNTGQAYAAQHMGHAMADEQEEEAEEADDDDMGYGLWDDAPLAQQHSSFASSGPVPGDDKKKKKKTSSSQACTGDVLHDLIDLQAFSGAWKHSDALFAILGLDDTILRDISCAGDSGVTALVIAYFELVLPARKDVWEMVVEKARAWLSVHVGGKEKAEEVVARARECVGRR